MHISKATWPTILWIDDEIDATNPAVRLLTLEGFAVECADSGRAGLTMLSSGGYDAVILDLRLPDTSGLHVLERLRADGLAVPVLMLTGYADNESATHALRLGVDDFRWKPLVGDELVSAVRTVVHVGAEAGAGASARRDSDVRPEIEGKGAPTTASLDVLMQRLDALVRTAEPGNADVADGPARQTVATRPRLLAAFMQTIEYPDIGVPLFLECAEALRQMMSAEDIPWSTLAPRLRELAQRPGSSASTDHRRVRRAIARLETAARNRVRLTEHQVASELAVDPAHLGRLLRSHTGVGFRQWRSALALRMAVRELADDAAQIAQIAFGTGYEHPSQLDREFRRLFGTSPREFRKIRRTVERFMIA